MPKSPPHPVQTGILYCAHLEFMAFDVAVHSSNGAMFFLDFNDAKDLTETAGFLHVQPLLVGSFREAIAYPFEFESTIPARLNMPPLPPGAAPNLAEGVVIKQLHETPGTRRVLKQKIDAFSEKRFNAAQKPNATRAAGTEGQSGALQVFKWEALANVTEQRLVNVLSKEGWVDWQDPTKAKQILRLFVADIMEATREDNPAEWVAFGSLSKGDLERKTVVQDVVLAAKRCIATYVRSTISVN